MADRRRAPAMRGSRILWLALVCLGSTMYMPARCQQHAAAQKTLPELPQVGNLPHLPALNVNSFAGSAVQPVLEALPNVAPTPSVQQVGYEAAHAAVLQANAASQAAKSAVAPSVAEVHAVEGPVQALAHAVNAVESDFAAEYGLGPSAQPPVPGPRPAMLRNIVITGEGDTTAEAEAAAPSQQGPPELPMLPQPAPLPQAPQPAVQAPAPAPGLTSLTSRSTDALHSAGVTSFQAVQQPQQPAEPKTELVSNKDGTQTVIVKMPRIEDPATSLQSQLPQLPSAGQKRRRLDELSAPAPAPVAMGPTRGLPSLPAVPSLGLPDMPQIALPATAEALVAPLPAPRPQGPAAAVAYEAAQPYSAFYKLLPVLSGTGVGRKLSQQPGPQQQQPGQQQQGPQQQAPQQPAGGQTQPQSFQQQSGQSSADQRQAAAVQSSAITIHPDITLDQDTKILTVGKGQASFFGQKYTLPALPFKLPATPALNSLQTIYPNMNLGDAPLLNAPAGAPGYAPAPQAEIAAAIAAEEAPTPEEKAVSNPVTNVLSALLAGRRLLQNQPGPQQPQQQQPGPQQQAPQQPAGGQTHPQSFQQQSGQSPADQRQAAAVQNSAITIHPDITLDQDTKIMTVGQGQASFFGQKYTLPALPFKLPATPALNSLQTIYPNMNLGDAPLLNAPAGAPGYAPAPQAEIAAAIAAEEAPTPEEKAISNPVTNVISALLAGRRLLQNQPGPQQPQQQQPGPQQQAPQQPAGGQTHPQSFEQQSGQSPADQRQAAAVQNSAITIHPDLTLDQNSKILTVGQGQASFFGQKYTLPALPFKLPATPALNSLQTIYPNMNLGDAPLNNAPAGAPGYAPAPQAEIAAAIAAEEAPTPEEKAVSNPVTNVLSALLAGRRLLQNQPGPQQQQQPGPQQQAPQQPAGGQTQPQSFQQQSGQSSADQRQAAAVQSSAITIHPDITLDQDTKILTVGKGQASFFGQKYTLPALPFKLPATPALNSLQTIYPNMNLGDAPLLNAPAGAPGYAPAPQAEIAAAIAAEEAPTPEEKAVSNPVTNVLSALLAGRRLQQTDFEQLNKAPLSVKDAAAVANSAIYQSLQEAQQIFNPPAVAPTAYAPSPSQGGGERGLPALPRVPTLGLAGMPAIALPSNPSELWAPLPAPNQNNIFATHTAEAVKPYTAFYDALPHVSASAISGRKLAQLPPPNDPSKPAQPFGYRNPKPLFQVEPKVLVDQKNKKAYATGGDVVLANGEKIPLPGGFALPTSGIWSGLLDIPQGAIVEGPVPAPDLAPAVPAHQAPAMAPAPSATPNNPLSFLVNALTTIGDAAQASANAAPATSGRRLAQLPPANDPNKPAQPFGYRNPKPLIQVEPKMLIDQKNRKAFATGGDILLANGDKIPLPGGFALPTTGLWSNLLDIPVGTQVEGPIPAPDLAPVAPAAQHAPAMAPAPSAMAAANAVNPLSFLVKGITSIGDALEAQANAKAGTRRRLLQREETVQGLTLSVALLEETKGTFAPKQEAFVKELEQGLGLQAGAVKVTELQMQKARYAEDVLRLGRHLMANAQTKEQADLVVTFTVETATPEESLAALKGMVGSSGQLTSALQSQARVHLVPDSLREVPPASDA